VGYDAFLAAVAGAFEVTPVAPPSVPAALEVLATAAVSVPAYVVTDGHRAALLEATDPARAAVAGPPGHSATWRALDASVLHHFVLGDLIAVPDADIGYHHDAAEAVTAARRHGTLAILMRAVPLAVVHQLAAAGERMPRKSTSFGPKPLDGLVLRLLDGRDGAAGSG
jgi:hypothetical protein